MKLWQEGEKAQTWRSLEASETPGCFSRNSSVSASHPDWQVLKVGPSLHCCAFPTNRHSHTYASSLSGAVLRLCVHTTCGRDATSSTPKWGHHSHPLISSRGHFSLLLFAASILLEQVMPPTLPFRALPQPTLLSSGTKSAAFTHLR